MKLYVVIVVVLVHAVLLGILFKPKSQEGPVQPPRATESGQNVEETAVKPVQADRLSVSPNSPVSVAEVPTTSKAIPSFDFSSSRVALPASLSSKVEGCRSGVLLDWTNRRVLWSRRQAEAVPLASITKMMTGLLVMESVERDPKLSLSTQVQVTRAAYKIGGSQVYLDPRERFSLDDLLKCIMIFSANDAAYLVAEFLGEGDESRFVQRMNQRSRELGLATLYFSNPHGLPAVSGQRDNQGSALDIAYLAGYLLNYPQLVRHSSTRLTYLRENTAKPFQLLNRNRLVGKVPGVNGMKTGYTKRAKYCIAATCERNGRVLVAVVTGCATSKYRDDLVKELLAWGYGEGR